MSKHFVVFAYGNEMSHMVDSPEVVVIKSKDTLSVYTSHSSYPNSKNIDYSKIQSEMAQIIDEGNILVLKNTTNYGLDLAWTQLGKSNPSDMLNHIEDRVFDIDNELKNLIEHSINLQDAIGPTLGEKYILHTEKYAPVWQKGSEKTIVQHCINDAGIVLDLIEHCSNRGLISVRSRKTGMTKGVEVEW